MMNIYTIFYALSIFTILSSVIFNLLYLHGAKNAEHSIHLKTPISIQRLSKLQLIVSLSSMLFISLLLLASINGK